MAILDDLLRKVKTQSGMFSPFALRSEKKLARFLGPSIVNAAGGLAERRVAAGSARDVATIGQRGSLLKEQLAQRGASDRNTENTEGKNYRQRIAIAGDKAIAEMMTKRVLAKTGMDNEAAYQRTELTTDAARDLATSQRSADMLLFDQMLQGAEQQAPYTYAPDVAAPSRRKKTERDEMLEDYLDVSVN